MTQAERFTIAADAVSDLLAHDVLVHKSPADSMSVGARADAYAWLQSVMLACRTRANIEAAKAHARTLRELEARRG